jgi:glycerol-3-phosphate dehydrogenase
VVGASGAGGRDWMQLSRKHAIEADPVRRHVTIFGGKLTDCLNVGEEICAEVRRLGVELSADGQDWYGEPDGAARQRFLGEAAALGLSGGGPGGEGVAERLWRRHGSGAGRLLEAIRRDPGAGRELVEGGAVLRCEVEEAARSELVVALEDFLRRRTALAQLVRREDLLGAAGVGEACRILFGEAAEARRAEYFGLPSPVAAAGNQGDSTG